MAEINKLSDTKLRKICGKPYSGKSVLSDGAGLSVRISKNGVIGWVYRYRLGGRETNPKWMSLGNYPDTSVKQARDKRDRCRAWLDQGKDPNIEMQIAQSRTLEPVTVREALEYWLNNYAIYKRKNYNKHRADFAKHVYPCMGHLPVEKLETNHWLDCFERIVKGTPSKGYRPAPSAAGYIFGNVKQALKFCRVRKYAISHALDDLTSNDIGSQQNERDRVLTDAEFADVLDFIDNGKGLPYYKVLTWLLIVFGARTREIRLSSWGEWDFNKGLWVVPVEHSKNGEIIVRPIPPALKGWLLELKASTLKTGYVLGELKRPEAVSSYGGGLWKKFKHDEKWTYHDLRRTMGTFLNDRGVAPHIVEHLLGHAVGGVAGIYNRSQYVDDKRAALDMWTAYLLHERSKPEERVTISSDLNSGLQIK